MANQVRRQIGGGLLALSLLVSLLLGMAATMEGLNPFDRYIDTQFAPGYTSERFDRVRPGMTRRDVQALLGRPLHVYQDYPDTTTQLLYYTTDAKLLESGRSGDFAWYESTVVLDSTQTVTAVRKGWQRD